MKRFNNPLKHVRVASPCHSDWDQMIGNERVRFCGQCALHVYNLSSMSRREAEKLIEQTEGRLCVRFYKRTDGSVITKDCPIGLRAIRRRMSYVARAVASIALSFLTGLGFNKLITAREIPNEVLMGDMATPVNQGAVVGETVAFPITIGKVAIKRPSDGSPLKPPFKSPQRQGALPN